MRFRLLIVNFHCSWISTLCEVFNLTSPDSLYQIDPQFPHLSSPKPPLYERSRLCCTFPMPDDSVCKPLIDLEDPSAKSDVSEFTVEVLEIYFDDEKNSLYA